MTQTAGPLAIGAILGDSDAESMAWSRAIGALSRQAETLSRGLTSPIRVNVVFHVDGRLVPNDFDGVRTGRFHKAESTLVVQAAVPAGRVGDRSALLLALLSEAVVEAEKYVVTKRLGVGLPEMRALVRQIEVVEATDRGKQAVLGGEDRGEAT